MKLNALLAMTAYSALAACGGGGGGESVTESPDASLQITPNNAMTVVGVAYDAALDSGGLGGLTGGAGLIGSAPGGVSKLDPAIAAVSESDSAASQVPIPPEITQCAAGGSTTVSGDIADPVTPTLSSGDFFQVDFAMCDDGFGVVTDGSLRMDIDNFTGDFLSELFRLTTTMTLTSFQVTSDIDVVTSNGAATVTIDTLNSPALSTSVSGNSIVVDTNTSSESLTNFSTTLTVDGNLIPQPFTMSASGTLDSTQLAGVINYSTPVIFEGVGSGFPSSGEFLVEGASSSLRLIAENNIDVRIEIDNDGDGVIDITINSTWAEITA